MSESADEWNESMRMNGMEPSECYDDEIMREGQPCCRMVVLSGPDWGTKHCDTCWVEFPTDDKENEYHVWEVGEVAFGDGSLYHNFEWGPYEDYNMTYLCKTCKDKYMETGH